MGYCSWKSGRFHWVVLGCVRLGWVTVVGKVVGLIGLFWVVLGLSEIVCGIVG